MDILIIFKYRKKYNYVFISILVRNTYMSIYNKYAQNGHTYLWIHTRIYAHTKAYMHIHVKITYT